MQTDTSPVRDTSDVPVTKIRTVRIDDALWQAAQDVARARRESVADVLRRALLAYVEDAGREVPGRE